MSDFNSVADLALQSIGAADAGTRTPDLQPIQPSDRPPGGIENARQQTASLRNALAFTQAVGVLIRSKHYREYAIGDLEWLLIPAIANRQFRLAEAKLSDAKGGQSLPVAIVLWALVSPEVDKRLMEAKAGVPKLEPAEWTSGEIAWLLHAAGEVRFVRPLVEQLMKTTFQGRKVKVLGRDQNNAVKIHVLESAADVASTA